MTHSRAFLRILNLAFCITVSAVRLLLTVYLMGIVVGLWRTDGPPATKLLLAVFWPIGPLAFAVTISGLAIVAAIRLVGRSRP